MTGLVINMLAMTAMLIGAVLGLRFKVLILVPATIIGSAAALAVGMAYGKNVWSILLDMVLVIAALEMGYLGGTVIRFVIAGTRVRKHSSGTVAVAQRPTP